MQHYAKGIASHVSRERLLNTLSKQSNIQMDRPIKKRKLNPTATGIPNSEIIVSARPSEHYQVSNDTRNPLRLYAFLREYDQDPAVKVPMILLFCSATHDFLHAELPSVSQGSSFRPDLQA
jgi:hypothetical protein